MAWVWQHRSTHPTEIGMTADQLRAKLIRNVNDGPRERLERAPLYDTETAGLSDGTAATKLGAGFDILQPGKIACPYHYHLAQEEMFVILEGEGTLRVAGERVPVKAGDVIFIPPGPEYPHHLINTGTAPMKYLSISTQERPELCYYPDSDKLGAFAKDHRVMQRRGQAVDYWEGEP
jgi:uncharacterized cupin superfamily protein